MKKQEVINLMDELKNKRTKTIQGYIDAMKKIIKDRSTSKSMWFWTDNGNRQMRHQREKYYHRDLHLPIGAHELIYYRDIDMSRKHVYVTEELLFDGEKATVADLNKMIEALEQILSRRGL